MAGLLKRSRRAGIALAIAVGLTVLSTVAPSLLGNELANWLPGTIEVLASESSNGGG